MAKKVTRRREVEARIGLACSTIYAMMADDRFPRPVKIGRRAVGWIEEDVNKWLRNKITQQSEQ